jgi:hypothetical protein
MAGLLPACCRLVEMCRQRHPEAFAAWEQVEPVLSRVLLMTPETPEDMLRALQVYITRACPVPVPVPALVAAAAQRCYPATVFPCCEAAC